MKFHHLALVNYFFCPPGRDHNEIQSVLLKLSKTSKVFTWQGNFEEFLLLTDIINWGSFAMPYQCSYIAAPSIPFCTTLCPTDTESHSEKRSVAADDGPSSPPPGTP